MDANDLAAWSLVDKFLSDPSLWGSNSFVVKADRMVGWQMEDFDLSPADDDDAAQQRRLVRRWADLSRLADVVPSGTRIERDSPLLSDLVQQVLAQGKCATGVVLSAADQEKLDQARNILFELGPDGLMQASVKSKTYSLYKQKYYAAEQALRAADLQAQNSGDVALVHQFQEIERPELVAAIASARLDWIELGFKNEVEEATSLRLAYAERSPSGAWSAFRSQFMSAKLKDLDGWQFYPVRVTPDRTADLIWTHAKVQLPIKVKYTPSIYLAITGESQVDFDRVEFDYAFLRIDRGWLDSSNSVLNSRIWRHQDYPAGSISDGKSPPKGKCPGFAVGLILVRALEIVSKHTSTKISIGNNVHLPSGFKSDLSDAFSTGGFKTGDALSEVGSGAHLPAMAEFKQLAKAQQLADAVSAAHFSVDAHPIASFDSSDLVLSDDLQLPKNPVALDDRIWDAKDFLVKPSGGLTPIPEVDPLPDPSTEDLIKRLKLMHMGAKPALNPKPALKTVAEVGETVRALFPPGRVMLGGVLCKSLPKLPDPDPGLTWI